MGTMSLKIEKKCLFANGTSHNIHFTNEYSKQCIVNRKSFCYKSYLSYSFIGHSMFKTFRVDAGILPAHLKSAILSKSMLQAKF
jgi:hypothetical protein